MAGNSKDTQFDFHWVHRQLWRFSYFSPVSQGKSHINNFKINNTASSTVHFIPSYISLDSKQRGRWRSKLSNLMQ